MISYDEALVLVREVARPLGSEEVALAAAAGRVLAAPVAAAIAAPPADVSAMDGYAVRDADLVSLPARLEIAGESFAGDLPGPVLERGRCRRIFTGAPVPPGTDRVVVQEAVQREGDAAVFAEPPARARHIRTKGSDFREGDVLLPEGTYLGPRQMVAAAGADAHSLTVWRRAALVVLGTGDELADPGTARTRPGAIPESVSFGVAALAEDWGARAVRHGRLPDRLDELERAAALALRTADVVVVTGGASVGERDFAKRMFEGLEIEMLFSKVAIKPGKPVWLARAAGRLVLGLPGNPTSAMVTARLFLAPLLAGLAGRNPSAALGWRRVPLAQPSPPTGERETFARGRIRADAVELSSDQDSSAQKTLAECDVLVRLRPGAPGCAPGDFVDVLEF